MREFARRVARAALLARGHAAAAEVQAFRTPPPAILVDVTEAQGSAAAAEEVAPYFGQIDEPADAFSVISHLRGIKDGRMVVFLNPADIARLGLAGGGEVELITAIPGGPERKVSGFRVVPYEIPFGCCAAYFPEANPLIPLDHHDELAHTPAYKATLVHVRATA